MSERTVDWTHELLDQLEFYWSQFRPGLDGLTDDEYLWEPCPGCWSIRTSPDGATQADLVRPEPDPPPFTTIAWRLAHITTGVLGDRAHNHFGENGGTFIHTFVAGPATAAAALAALDESYEAWHGGISGLDADGLAAPCGPAEGPFAEHPMAALVLHINREVMHHGAEVLCLRDLYRCTDGGRTVDGQNRG